MTDLFASAKRSLRRGRHHMGDLGEKLNALNAKNEYATFVVEAQPDGATEFVKLRFHPLFRDEFPSIVFDAVSNFRASLDQMTYAIAIPGGLDPEKYHPFPICKGVEFIDNQINGLKYLPPEIRTLFRSFAPYKGGNDTIWALNELCNVQKHAALIPVDMINTTLALRPRSGTSLKINGPVVRITPGAFDAEANEVAIGLYPKGAHAQTETEVTFAVVLYHSEKVISGQHPIFLLSHIATMVDRILSVTEAECRRIGIIN